VLNKIINLPRKSKQLIALLVDSAILIAILLIAFSARLGHWYFPQSDLIWVIFGAPLIAIPIFMRFGLYRAVIRYIGFKALWSVIQAVSLYALIWGIAGFMMALDGIPRSVILINWALSLLAIGGLRIVARAALNGNIAFFIQENVLRGESKIVKKRVLIYGAGDAGIQLISALKHSAEYQPVGFIDDAKALQGHHIEGLEIFSIDNLSKIIAQFKVGEVLIALPSVARAKRLSIIDKLEPFPVVVRLLPGIAELAEGKVSIADLREVSLEELLGRDVVRPNEDLLGKNISQKVVLVTGAGGSIGAELCRQIVRLKPKSLVLFEISELALYTIEKELARVNHQSINIYPILGNINHKNRLRQVFKHFEVDTIYHAAAYKHVPMVEFNNSEGVNNNILGTLNVAQAAINQNVATFVLISTDKAVRPTNTMGASKRVAELTLQALANRQNTTRFSMVRFGNVLGSSGSVIPLFRQQIKAGGPITVTDKNMVRYFMTTPEAVELVIQAGAMGAGGDVFVLDMGAPVKIDDLAQKMIHLSGLDVKNTQNPQGDIEIKYTGLRPGEKLYEELLIGDKTSKTPNPLIQRAEENSLKWCELQPILESLKEAVEASEQDKIRELLIQAVPEFKPQCRVSDLLHGG
jgi:FlaA1/EpsC-like NDP-sugar epimerase